MLEDATLIVGTDLSQVSQPALEAAASLARRFGAARVVVVHGLKEGGALAGLDDAQARAAEKAGSAIEAVTPDVGGARIERVVRAGAPAKVLVEVARERSARLIVVASHGFGALRRAVLGSVANATVRAAPCPVLVVGSNRPGQHRLEGVTAAVDLSPISDRVVKAALAVAATDRAPVRLISVLEAPSRPIGEDPASAATLPEAGVERVRTEQAGRLDALAASAPAEAPVKTALLEGAIPAEAILRDLGRTAASLLVVGASGDDAWNRLVLGSTAERLVAEAPCPVLVIPAEAAAAEG